MRPSACNRWHAHADMYVIRCTRTSTPSSAAGKMPICLRSPFSFNNLRGVLRAGLTTSAVGGGTSTCFFLFFFVGTMGNLQSAPLGTRVAVLSALAQCVQCYAKHQYRATRTKTEPYDMETGNITGCGPGVPKDSKIQPRFANVFTFFCQSSGHRRIAAPPCGETP